MSAVEKGEVAGDRQAIRLKTPGSGTHKAAVRWTLYDDVCVRHGPSEEGALADAADVKESSLQRRPPREVGAKLGPLHGDARSRGSVRANGSTPGDKTT